MIRIDRTSQTLRILQDGNGKPIPAVGVNKEVKNIMAQLENGTEAVVEGEIQYHHLKTEGSHQLDPYFVIYSIHPVSLKELGIHQPYEVESHLDLLDKKTDYIPPSLPVTTEVASALTLTTSLLLMNELTSEKSSNSLDKDLRTTLFLSTGLIATIILIYDKFEGKNRP
jgi:hypothetical protein